MDTSIITMPDEPTGSTQAVVEQPTGISGGLEALGLDGKLLAAQIINFVILLLILRKFVYGPLVGLLERRKTTIEESLKKASEIEERYEKFQIEHARRVEESKAEAATIIRKAKEAADKLRASDIEVTKQETEKMLLKAKAEIEKQKDTLLTELKQEVGSLVVEATGKIIGKELDDKTQSRLLIEATKEVK